MARVSRRKQIAAAQGVPVDELPKAAVLRIFRTALYVRLSIMDTRDRKDSESLQTQIDYLCGYIAKHPDLELYDCYRDNGETGTNFERPGFQRMMEDVKAGRVDCIIVKDLSRFGRDFLETGNFLEKVLPFMGVRFISVNDNYDSIRADSGEAMTIALKNLMNDIYAKDISQKVYSALDTKKRSGEFIGNFAAYGYVKSPEDRHKLAVDPDAAKVVRRIFRMKKDGMSNAAIARTLTAEQIPNPNYHRYLQGIIFAKRFSENAPWQTQTVKHILENPVYLGHMAQGKKITKLHAGQKQKTMPSSEWIIVPNTHEAIIEQELFDAVQAILKAKHEEYHSRLGKYAHFDIENIFEGLVACACCQHNMTRYIPIVQVPSHQGKHLCEEDLAGDLLGLTPAGTGGTPGAGISVLCPTGADRQNLTLLVDEHLYLIHLGKTVQAGSVYIELVVVKGHRGLIDMGKELPTHYLIAVVIEFSMQFQNFIPTSAIRWDGLRFHLQYDRRVIACLFSIQSTEHCGDYALRFSQIFIVQLWFLLPALAKFLANIGSQLFKASHTEFLSGFIELSFHADLPVFFTLVTNQSDGMLMEIILLSKRANPLFWNSPYTFTRDGKRPYGLRCTLLPLLTRKQVRFNKCLRIVDVENIR